MLAVFMLAGGWKWLRSAPLILIVVGLYISPQAKYRECGHTVSLVAVSKPFLTL